MAPPPVPNWQAQILHGIGAPVTPQNLLYLNDWARAEGGSASNNPFNTTQPAAGAGSYNSVGVRNYGSPQQGIQATIQTLKNGRYGGIIGALQQGTSARAAADALAASPWGTGSLVQKMLGGGQSGSLPAMMSPPVSPGGAGRAPAAPGGNPLLGQLLSQTNQMVGLGANPTLAGLLGGGGAAPAPRAAAAAAPVAAGSSGGRMVTVDGVQVSPAIAKALQGVVSQFGVHPTSGYRSADHNAAVGGAQNSDHLGGNAVDFGGTPQQLAALYKYAQGRYPYVEPMAQAKDHVHISFSR